MRKTLLAFFWLPVSFFTLTASLILLFLSTNQGAFKQRQESYQSSFFPVSSVLGVFNSNIISADARPEIVRRFLTKYKSPLESYAKLLVETADKYNLDFRLLPAIAMQESNLCQKIPENSYNCWGFGIYGDKILRFSSYEEGIERVAESLAKNYAHRGLLEPEDIMKKYTPQSQGSWAYAVYHFMEQMK